MLKLTGSICIKAPVSAVWACLSEFESVHAWDPAILRSYCLEQSQGVGATRVCKLAWATARETIIEWDEGRSFTYQAVGVPLLRSATNKWSVEARGRETLVTSLAEVVLKGRFLGRLLQPLLKRVFDRLGARSLVSLKRHIEQGLNPSAPSSQSTDSRLAAAIFRHRERPPSRDDKAERLLQKRAFIRATFPVLLATSCSIARAQPPFQEGVAHRPQMSRRAMADEFHRICGREILNTCSPGLPPGVEQMRRFRPSLATVITHPHSHIRCIYNSYQPDFPRQIGSEYASLCRRTVPAGLLSSSGHRCEGNAVVRAL